jgi:ribonuclease J
LVHHAKLAEETGVPADRVLIAQNGSVVEVSKDRVMMIDQFPETKVFLEDRKGKAFQRTVLKERRKLAAGGVGFVFAAIVEENAELLSGPEVILRGVISPEDEITLVPELTKVLRRQILHYLKEKKHARQKSGREDESLDLDFLNEQVRIEARKFFFDRIGKKPVIQPFLVEV